MPAHKHEQTKALIQARLEAAFSPLSLQIKDESAKHAGHAGAATGGGHFALSMVSEAFKLKPRLLRQRLVYDQLADLLERDIHALSMKLLAPDEVRRA